MCASPLVEFREVTKRFGDGPLVLDRINLAAPPGEFISLIGPSGCGKSTLLRLIAGLSPVGSGTLNVRSEEHTSELQSHRDLHSFPTRRSSDLARRVHQPDRTQRLWKIHAASPHRRSQSRRLRHAER